jgi:hypothetical protein
VEVAARNQLLRMRGINAARPWWLGLDAATLARPRAALAQHDKLLGAGL